MYAICSSALEVLFKTSTYHRLDTIVPKKCKSCSFEASSNLLLLHHLCSNYKRHILVISKRQILNDQRFCLNGGFFKCQYCDYEIRRKGDMRKHVYAKHLTKHEKQRLWHKCEHCDYRSDRLFVIKQHTFRQHSDKNSIDWIQCERCDYKTKIKENYQNHRRRQHLNTKVNCSYCNLLVGMNYLKSHIAGVHTDQCTEHKCMLCAKTFKWKTSLQKHVRKEHCDPQWHKCPHCDYKDKDRNELQTHVVTTHK